MKRIALLTDLTPAGAAADSLRRLDNLGQVEIRPLGGFGAGLSERFLDGCDALICRKVGCPPLEPRHLAGVNRPFIAATLTAGEEHLDAIRGPNVRILSGEGRNAVGVAELTLTLANLLLRPVHWNMELLRTGAYHREHLHKADRIEGKHWLTVGGGSLVRALLPRLTCYSPARITIRNRTMSLEWMRKFLEEFPDGWRPEVFEEQGEPRARLFSPTNGGIELRGSKADLSALLSDADIVSIQVPPAPELQGLFDQKLLAAMKKGALLINVSRGSLVVEADVLAALMEGRLGGYATDVLPDAAEEDRNVDASPLWARAVADREWVLSEPDRALNLVITAHIGGATLPDFERIAAHVLKNLLTALELEIPAD